MWDLVQLIMACIHNRVLCGGVYSFIYVALGLILIDSQMLDKVSTTELHPKAYFHVFYLFILRQDLSMFVQYDLQLLSSRMPPALAFHVLELQVYATVPS